MATILRGVHVGADLAELFRRVEADLSRDVGAEP
jgi:hypothetical protein